MQNFFDVGAKERLMTLFPENGEFRFERLNEFCSIAKANPGVGLVVPAEIDQDLHEVLSARKSNGEGFETCRVSHEVKKHLDAIGKSLNELTDECSISTRKILSKNNFVIEQMKYDAHACTLVVLN